MSWYEIHSKVIVQEYLTNCCFSRAMDGSEDCILWEDSDRKDTVRVRMLFRVIMNEKVTEDESMKSYCFCIR